MAQEQLSGWADVAIAAVSGLVAGVSGLLVMAFRMGGRDKAIDQSIAETAEELTNKLHELRLYVDAQDKQNRHDMYGFIQQLLGKLELDLEKLENQQKYHQRHDDRRFEAVSNRIWMVELRNAQKDGTRLPHVPPTLPSMPEPENGD